MNFPADRIRAQIVAILTAWGMDPELVQTSADVMIDTDLAGIDSHGFSMLTLYEDFQLKGRLNLKAHPVVKKEGPATALIDAGASLGHPASVMGMKLAIAKAKKVGVGVVTVVNSTHYGPAGYYAAMASKAGLLGMVMSSARGVGVVPTRAAVPVLGTNPIAFAAPAKRNRPFLLDMATSTVAMNKVKVYDFNHKPLVPGWVLSEKGQPVTDAAEAMARFGKSDAGGLTPIGGTVEMGSHKGYGLAMMAQILSATLCGGSFSPIRNLTQKPNEPDNNGHFFMAIDPLAFREEGAFETDMDAAIDFLHRTPPVDPALPVLVPGDPEAEAREVRQREGIPVPPALFDKIRAICSRAGAPFLLE